MRALRDLTAQITRDYDRKRSLDDISTIMAHRIGVGESALQVAEWFREHGPDWIGTRSMPYTFIITRLGLIEQALPLTVKSPHARKWNRSAVGIGVVGDFRETEPSNAQTASFIVLCARLQDRLGRQLTVIGHTDVKDSTRDPSKVCPGRLFPLSSLREVSYSMGQIIC